MEKRTFTATGDADHDDGSTSAKRYRSDSSINLEAAGDEHDANVVIPIWRDKVTGFPNIPSDPVKALGLDIKDFEQDKRVFTTLKQVVSFYADDDELNLWFTKLRERWNQSPPNTPKEAARLVFEVLMDIYSGYIEALYLDGMFCRYGLADYIEVAYTDDYHPHPELTISPPRRISTRYLEMEGYFLEEDTMEKLDP